MLLIDGDIVVYRCAWKSQDETEEAALSTVKHFMYDLVTTTYSKLGVDDEDAMDFNLYLTGKGNYRHDVAVSHPYKGNRKDKERPQHIDAIRQYLIENWDAVVCNGEEADDRIAIDMTNNPDAVSVSVDKDFLQIPGKHIDMVTGAITEIDEMEGLRRFYKQVLTGDRVDNIMGIKGVGPVKADKFIDKCKTETEMYNVCVEQYEKAGMPADRVIENARLLWLRRSEGELWSPPESTSEE